MMDDFKKKIDDIEQGRIIYTSLVGTGKITIGDRFVFLLTKDKEMLEYVKKYIDIHIEQSKQKVHIVTDGETTISTEADKIILLKEDIRQLIDYLSVIEDEMFADTKAVLIDDVDASGTGLKSVLELGYVTKEEYVKKCLLKVED